MVQKPRLATAFILLCFSYHKPRRSRGCSETQLQPREPQINLLNYPRVWLPPMALPIYFLLPSEKTAWWQFPILSPWRFPHSTPKYSGSTLYSHYSFQFPDLEAEQRQPALMEKTLVHSGFTLDPSQFLDISQLLYIHLPSYKTQWKLASTLLALKYENIATVKPENRFLVDCLQSICSKTVSAIHCWSAKF